MDADLASGRWKYKVLHGPAARAAKLRQIYLDGPRGIYRAALIVRETDDPCMVFLIAYHKRDQTNQTAIDRATVIAADYWEGRR